MGAINDRVTRGEDADLVSSFCRLRRFRAWSRRGKVVCGREVSISKPNRNRSSFCRRRDRLERDDFKRALLSARENQRLRDPVDRAAVLAASTSPLLDKLVLGKT